MFPHQNRVGDTSATQREQHATAAHQRCQRQGKATLLRLMNTTCKAQLATGSKAVRVARSRMAEPFRKRSGHRETMARAGTPQEVETQAAPSKEQEQKKSTTEQPDKFRRAIDEVIDLERLGQRGEGWFVAQMVLFGLVIFPPHLEPFLAITAPLLIPSGLLVIAAGQSVLGGNLSPFPEPSKTNQLVTSGIYGMIRHPMYTGGLMSALGLAGLTASKERMFLTLVLFFVLNVKASKEEDAMTKKHPEYKEYVRSTYKFFPWIY